MALEVVDELGTRLRAVLVVHEAEIVGQLGCDLGRVALIEHGGEQVAVGLSDRLGHLRRLGGAGPEVIFGRALERGSGLDDAGNEKSRPRTRETIDGPSLTPSLPGYR